MFHVRIGLSPGEVPPATGDLGEVGEVGDRGDLGEAGACNVFRLSSNGRLLSVDSRGEPVGLPRGVAGLRVNSWNVTGVMFRVGTLETLRVDSD